jgi:hypothetical protein
MITLSLLSSVMAENFANNGGRCLTPLVPARLSASSAAILIFKADAADLKSSQTGQLMDLNRFCFWLLAFRVSGFR